MRRHRERFALFALFLPISAAAQVSIGKVEIAPASPTLTDTITFDVQVTAPASCALEPENVQVEPLPSLLRITLPPCASDGTPLIERTLSTFVSHQMPGTYLLEIFPGGVFPEPLEDDGAPDLEPPMPPEPEPLWSGTVTVVEPSDDFYSLDDGTRVQTCGTASTNPGAPCAYQKAIFEFLDRQKQPDPRFRWQNNLDWDFRNWRDGGSQNLPLLAQALALVLGSPDLPRTKLWWNRFFDCQVGGACAVANPGTLPFFSGGEILSSTYNHDAVLAAMAVNFWTTRLATRDLPLARKARNYLRATWYFYTLAAGTAEARNYRQNNTTSLTLCQWTGNNRPFYNGPFLALAGARSTPTSACIDNRAPIYARAVRWETFTRSGESFEQKELRTLLENRYVPDTSPTTERIFAIDEPTVERLKRHVRGTTNEARWLFDRLTELRVRLSREMRFLGWANGVRASLLAENPNLCSSCFNGQCGQTAALFAAKFTPGTPNNEAHFLFPWSNNGIRRGLTRGSAKMLPDVTAPTFIQASNLANGESEVSCHPRQVVEMSLPPAPPTYQVLVGPLGPVCVRCP